jgi:hypothetical protein
VVSATAGNYVGLANLRLHASALFVGGGYFLFVGKYVKIMLIFEVDEGVCVNSNQNMILRMALFEYMDIFDKICYLLLIFLRL